MPEMTRPRWKHFLVIVGVLVAIIAFWTGVLYVLFGSLLF